MRVLFDQGTPVPLRMSFADPVVTAYEVGWSELNNGDLIRQAEQAGFEVLVTTDTNLRYQQTITNRSIAIAVMKSTSWPRIRIIAEDIADTIQKTEIGAYIENDIPALPK